MPNAIRKCELEMTLAVLRAIEGGCALELYKYDNSYSFYLRPEPCPHCGLSKVAKKLEENQHLKSLFVGDQKIIKRGPWLPGAIAQAERELEGL